VVSANGNDEHRVTSLRDLPQAIAPPRDLWSGIESRIAEERRATGGRVGREQSAGRSARIRWIAAAAMIASVALGIWIGRSVLPMAGKTTGSGMSANPSAGAPGALQAAYLVDPRYRSQREALVKSLETQLAALPPDSRAKVIASLATIHRSMQDLEAALGRDPSNALLQELLVNTYQDEMRVLTAVHEAGDAGKGI
jgi:hypothetical protein